MCDDHQFLLLGSARMLRSSELQFFSRGAQVFCPLRWRSLGRSRQLPTGSERVLHSLPSVHALSDH